MNRKKTVDAVPAVALIDPAPALPTLEPTRDESLEFTTTAVTENSTDNRIHLAILFVLALLLQIVWIQPAKPTESNELIFVEWIGNGHFIR